jgi:hypothetical protein
MLHLNKIFATQVKVCCNDLIDKVSHFNDIRRWRRGDQTEDVVHHPKKNLCKALQNDDLDMKNFIHKRVYSYFPNAF